MKMKNFAVMIAALSIAATCVACGSDDSKTNSTTSSTAETTTVDFPETTSEGSTGEGSTTDGGDTSVVSGEPVEVTPEIEQEIDDAAQNEAKKCIEEGVDAATMEHRIAVAAATVGLKYGITDPQVVSPHAGKAAGMNGANGQNAGDQCAEMLANGKAE